MVWSSSIIASVISLDLFNIDQICDILRTGHSIIYYFSLLRYFKLDLFAPVAILFFYSFILRKLTNFRVHLGNYFTILFSFDIYKGRVSKKRLFGIVTVHRNYYRYMFTAFWSTVSRLYILSICTVITVLIKNIG